LRTQFTDVADIAATIYEITGIQFPSAVDGIEQQALDGVSFADSFANPTAVSRHRTQLFELFGNRAIYHEGWMAIARHAAKRGVDRDDWTLYSLDADFAQASDLASRYPGKLKELQALCDLEARRNNVYPLQTLEDLYAALKSKSNSRRTFVYYPELPRTYAYPDGLKVPDFSRSHRITAEAFIPQQGARGTIMAVGSRHAGFAFYVDDDRLVYENHFLDAGHETLRSRMALPRGRVTLTYEFVRDKSRSIKAGYAGDDFAPGIGSLYLNGELIAEHSQKPVVGWILGYGAHGGTLGIGKAFSPVGTGFEPPFKFTGTLERITVAVE
jgi:hypothetical protein